MKLQLLLFSIFSLFLSDFCHPTFEDLADLSKEIELKDLNELKSNRSSLKISSKNGSTTRPIHDKATIRTLSIIHYKGTENRLVLLLCRNQCVRHRSLVPRWIREFANEHNSTQDDPIFFHYHYLKRMRLPVYSLEAKIPSVFYFIGGTYFAFDGDLSNKDQFINWLEEREDLNSRNITTWNILENVLQENSDCNGSNQLLIISSADSCPYDYWRNLARSLNMQSNLSLCELQRPFNVEIDIVLQQRFPKLSGDCLQMVLISNNAYTELNILDSVSDMREDILAQLNRECVPPQFPWLSIEIPLTEIQLEYYSRDSLLRTNEMKPHFIVVGAIAGVSVVALAISIFWGLNGTAFTAQK